MFAPDVNRADCGFPHNQSKGSCSKTALVSQTSFSILYLECTHAHIYTSLPVFFFLSFFPILWFVNFAYFFHFVISFFSNSQYYKKQTQFLQKQFVATVRKITAPYRISFVFPLRIYLL
jgi:hypothetical protein